MFNSWQRAKQFEDTALPHLADVYRLARRMSDPQLADDLVQETFLRAWKYFGTFEQGTNIKAWLFRILQNVLTDHWRRRRAEVQFDEEESGIEPYYDWEDDFLKDELSGTLEQALSRLPEKYRWALLLADVQELSYQEIASVMGCPVGTVMSRLNRARRTLARLLRPELETYGAS